MKHYRVWAYDKSPKSVVIQSKNGKAAQAEAMELMALGEWSERIEQAHRRELPDWQIISVEQLCDPNE